jgi:hypothetical protein
LGCCRGSLIALEETAAAAKDADDDDEEEEEEEEEPFKISLCRERESRKQNREKQKAKLGKKQKTKQEKSKKAKQEKKQKAKQEKKQKADESLGVNMPLQDVNDHAWKKKKTLKSSCQKNHSCSGM